MDYLTCSLINGPFVIFNTMANAFYAFCMVCPLQGGRIKQPLKLLLGSLICCTITYQMSAMMLFFCHFINDSFNFILPLNVATVCSFSTSMSFSVWLNFFYYTQIVPSQRALFIWIKKNIKPFIYCIWLAETMFSLFKVGVLINYLSYNVIVFNGTIYLQTPESELDTNLLASAFITYIAHFAICLCVMMMASSSTAIYLCRHMCRMVANGQPFSCPQFRNQVRVTVTGILQVVLHVLCSVWIVYNHTPSAFYSQYIYFTIINFYMVGTTFNLGAGQAVFRQRVEDIWLRAVQLCKAPKVKQSDRGG